MAIRVTDTDGHVDEFEDDGTASFETEQVSNNLCVQTTERYVVYAEGKWVKAEQDAPDADYSPEAEGAPDGDPYSAQ